MLFGLQLLEQVAHLVFVDASLDAAALGQRRHLLFHLLCEVGLRHLDGVEPLAGAVGEVLFQHRLLLCFRALLGFLTGLSVGVATATGAVLELLQLLFAQFFESVVVWAPAHRDAFTARAKNDFGGSCSPAASPTAPRRVGPLKRDTAVRGGMSESREFCPRCGDAVPERRDPLPGEPSGRDALLCDDCYFADFSLVDAPDRIEVLVCAGCGAVHRGDSWRDVGARDYTDVAVDEVAGALGVHVAADAVEWGVEPEQVDENTIRMHCRFSGVVRGTLRDAEVTVPVKISRGTCTRCGRIAGGYYAGVVQVRADDRELTSTERTRAVEIAESYVADQEADGDREAFLTEVKQTPDGPNVKLSTNRLAQNVATQITTELGGSYESYPTLVTEDGDGNEVYRVTFAVRLPRYAPGEILDPNDGDGPVLVTGVSGRLSGVRLATGASYASSFEAGAAPEATRLGTREDASETTVVTVEDDHAIQVLDPETYAARTVPNPSFVDADAETVLAFKHGDAVHLVPPET